MLSDEWFSRYGLLENFNASVTRTGTGTGTWTTGVTAIALCTSCSRANKVTKEKTDLNGQMTRTTGSADLLEEKIVYTQKNKLINLDMVYSIITNKILIISLKLNTLHKKQYVHTLLPFT